MGYGSNTCAMVHHLKKNARVFYQECEEGDHFEWLHDNGQIKSVKDESLCWSIKNVNRASSNIMLKTCNPNDERQLFRLENGNIWIQNNNGPRGMQRCIIVTNDKAKMKPCHANLFGGQ